jgi:hypothetical protein
MEPGFWVAKTVATPANKALIVLRYGLTPRLALWLKYPTTSSQNRADPPHISDRVCPVWLLHRMAGDHRGGGAVIARN